MFRISKMTDYGTLILAHLEDGDDALTAASEIAARTGLGTATVSKLLKALARAGLVTATRGARGGYALSRPAADISAADIIDAIEGPVAITDCAVEGERCDLEAVCGVGSAWQQINASIRRALRGITLDDLKGRRPIPTELPLMPLSALTQKDAHR